MASLDAPSLSMTQLILASASPARRRALIDAGIDPVVIVSDVDEEAMTAELGALAPAELALVLAQAKARDVAQRLADGSLIVGCDSVFELDGIAYGKPMTPQVAIERITAMSGRTGHLHTGHWIVLGDRQLGRTTTTTVEFAVMRPDEIAAYVATGEPLNVAGAFTLDGRAAPYVRSITGDPSNVLGISLPTMRLLLQELGVNWPEFWRALAAEGPA